MLRLHAGAGSGERSTLAASLAGLVQTVFRQPEMADGD